MKSLVVYSSRTGNTKRVAEAIFEILPEFKMLSPVEEAPHIDAFDLIAIGFWIDRGFPDAKAQEYMKTLHGKNIAIFGTLGSYADSDYVTTCVERVKDLLTANTILGTFMCQGRIAPEVLEIMGKTRPLTPKKLLRIEDAQQHPDADDLFNAQETFRVILTQL